MKLFVTVALLFVIAIMPAGAWLGPNVQYEPLPVAQPAPYGTLGSGFFETESWSAGTGAATTSDQFFSGIGSPLGGLYSGGCGPWGYGWPFTGGCGPWGYGSPAGGLWQSGLGGNIGAQNSAMGTYTRSTAFGLAPINALIFGLYYC